MKFALVNGQRQEAQPNLSAECLVCGHPMIAKCGEVKVRHWAHKVSRPCDPWWENETEWHRGWKGQFPVDWQEFVHQAENGDKHIADVKTNNGWVIEFQHSYIKPEERRSRDIFYPKLIWVVNGARRKRDGAEFLNAWKEGIPIGANSLVRRAFSDACVLLREWAGSRAPVFFDFGGEQVLWWLLKSSNGAAYVAPFSRTNFIAIHRGAATPTAHDFDKFVMDLGKLVTDYESHLRSQAMRRVSPLQGFQQYLIRRDRLRRRL